MSEAGLVQRTIWILRAVASRPDGMGLSEVARASGIPKATCYRVLSVLEQERWLLLDSHTKRYRVSLGLLSVVGGLLDTDGAYAGMRQILTELAEQTQETAGLDVLLTPHVMVVAQVPGPRLIGQAMRPVPRTQPVWRTATGKALLSHMGRAEVLRDFAEDFAADPPEGATTLDAFLDGLVPAREQGYAYAFDELEKGAASVAAIVPVRHSAPYGVWIGGPTFRITQERIPELAEAVRAAARSLEEILNISGVVFRH
ncbi:hypothetical protein GCM10010191_63310 [Actinomadura vinacea]|uniref:IclR family transcriptional regulator n=1 Tax=Actinomadura vinacea TaxID=115336 RepID=A0ABN3JTM7_9ACTN